MKINKIHPLDGGVVVRREQADNVTTGGIHLPDDAQEKSRIGTVIAVGPGFRKNDGTDEREPIDLKVGDRVVLPKYGGNMEVEVNGEECIIINADALLGEAL